PGALVRAAGMIELHAHSCFSFLDGASQPHELAFRAAELGHTALALTDHDSLSGSLEFANAARDCGLRPITGCEITLAARSRRPPPNPSVPPAPGHPHPPPPAPPRPLRRPPRAVRHARAAGHPRRGAALPLRLRPRRARRPRRRRRPHRRGRRPCPPPARHLR